MVFVRSWCAKKCHHAIALDLVDNAVVAMNSILHEIKHGLKTPHAQFGIAQTIDQTRRISDVRKKYSKAFAFSALGAQRPKHALRA